MEKEYATVGNYESLRSMFFVWRDLFKTKAIYPHGLNKLEQDFCKEIAYKKTWTTAQAHQLYFLIKRYSFEMKRWGVDYSKVPQPTFIDPAAEPRKAQTRVNTLYYDGEFLVLQFNYNPDYNLQLQSIPDRRFDREKKLWLFPIAQSRLVMAFAERNNFAIGESAKRVIYDYDNNYEQSYGVERVELNLGLKKELFDYQTVGVDFGIRIPRVWNADQMGLGKTPQAIATAVGWGEWPVLVVCPKSLRNNWKEEIESWTKYKAMIATPKNMIKLHRFLEMGLIHFVIVNYDGVKTNFTQDIKQIDTVDPKEKEAIHLNGKQKYFKGLIVDESHSYRNPKTNRYKILAKVIENIPKRQLLSGTPYVNNERDIAAQLDLLGVLERFGGMTQFLKRYSNMNKGNFYSNKKGQPDNLAELNTKLRSICMFRREKHQVLHQLPDKFRTLLKVELENQKEYDLAFISLQAWMVENDYSQAQISKSLKAEILTRMNVLKRLSAKGKVGPFAEFANNVLEQGEKIVVFCWHLETIDAVRQYFPNVLEISGRVNDAQVSRNIFAFQNDPLCNMIILTFARGGVGFTLTAGSVYVGLEPAWNPAAMDQAEDRLHRIGQKKNVTCYQFIGKGTIDEHIYKIIEDKRKHSKESVGSTEEIETSVQSELISMLINKKKENVLIH